MLTNHDNRRQLSLQNPPMKVVVPKQQLMTTKVDYLPLIPDKELDSLTKDNSIGFSLKTNPANADSSTYKVNVRILQGGESVRVMHSS